MFDEASRQLPSPLSSHKRDKTKLSNVESHSNRRLAPGAATIHISHYKHLPRGYCETKSESRKRERVNGHGVNSARESRETKHYYHFSLEDYFQPVSLDYRQHGTTTFLFLSELMTLIPSLIQLRCSTPRYKNFLLSSYYSTIEPFFVISSSTRCANCLPCGGITERRNIVQHTHSDTN